MTGNMQYLTMIAFAEKWPKQTVICTALTLSFMAVGVITHTYFESL
jgi:hypothetical protein